MKTPVAPSLRIQTLAVLIVGLLISHFAGLYIYTLDRRSAVTENETLDVAERASGVIVVLRNVPDDWRQDVLTASDSRSFRVWRTESTVLAAETGDEGDARLLEYLRNLLPRLADREMRVAVTHATPPGAAPPPRAESPGAPTTSAFDNAARIVTISIHHPGGFWINFAAPVPRPTPAIGGGFMAYILTVAFAAAIISFWLVNRVTQPLQDFADAADRLGTDIRALPLAPKGPREVSQAAQAFNRMQERIARLIENRIELLAAISHDLRTPITRLKLRAELLEDGEEREKFLTTLEEMETIMATFLDYARSSFGKEERSRVELTSLVESVCIDFSDVGADVVTEESAPIHIVCKRTAVRRALNNIIDNAIKYAGGARVRVARGEDLVSIIVEDDGPGVADDALEAILMPFHRGEPSRSKETGGAGLGLSIALAVAHDHGGDLKLSNRTGGGLRVELQFPGRLTATRAEEIGGEANATASPPPDPIREPSRV